MRDVRLVEVDGDHLVLVDESGARYQLVIDDRLRAATRHDQALLDRLDGGRGEPLRPKEIQARLRAGVGIDELSRVTGLTAEHIDRYAGPVLAEREHIADNARKVAVARSAKGDTSLDEAVLERLSARDAAEHTAWDSWREEAGSWIVEVVFDAGGKRRNAQWRYHPADATIDPIDDEARWLTGVPEPEPEPRSGVTERVFDVEANGSVREQGKPVLRSDPSGVHTLEDDPQARTLDLLDALRGRRGRRQPTEETEADSQPDLVDALLDADDDDDESGAGFPPPAHPPASRPEQATDAEILSLPEPAPAAEQAPPPEPEPDNPSPRRRARAANKRASVPSWDDIMFGAKKD